MATVHHLRVVKFDKSSDNEVVKEASRNICKKVLDYDNKITPNESTKKHDAVTTNRPIKKMESCRTNKNINFRSTSELFRNYRNNNILRSLSTRTWSLDDIREKLKNVHRQRLKTSVNKKQSNIRFKKYDKSQDDIKVLYTSERLKGQKAKKDLSMIPSGTRLKNSANQLFRSNSSTRRNTYLCYQTCRNIGLFPIPKKRKKKTESKTYILHTVYPLSIKKSKTKKKLRFCESPEHYSLVGFPVTSKTKLEPMPLPQEILFKKEPPLIRAVDCKGDCIGVSKVLVEPSGTNIGSAEKPLTVDKKVSGHSCLKNLEHQEKAVNHFFEFFKSALMYFLLALIFVVWLPCIIVGVVCWFLIFLMRPQECTIEANEPLYSKCKESCKYKKTFYRIKRWLLCNAKRFICMVRNLAANDDDNVTSTPRPKFHQLSMPTMPCQVKGLRRKNLPNHRCKWQPDPGKRYVLYYNDDRGWLMKPVRNQVCDRCNRAEIVEQDAAPNWSDKKHGKRDRTVTFWDALDRGACKCDHASPKEEEKFDECTQATCRDPRTKLPTCAKCPEFSPERKVVRRKSKPKTIFKPCPTARPCPARTRKKLLRMQQQAAKQAEMARRLSVNRNGARVSIRNDVNRSDHDKTSSYRKLEDNEEPTEKLSMSQSIKKYFKDTTREMKEGYNAIESTWGEGVQCGSLYLATLKKRPCFWIHKRWPHLYPAFLSFHQVWTKCSYGFMFFLAALVWCPLFFCCYLCYTLFCMMLGGGCECDCDNP